MKFASVYKRVVPFADGTSAEVYLVEVASGGWLDLLSQITWDIGMARGFPERKIAVGVAEREGYTVVNK